MTLRRHLSKARVPDGQEGSFSASEEAVDGDEQRDEEETNGRVSH